jgi:hypothetical protein
MQGGLRKRGSLRAPPADAIERWDWPKHRTHSALLARLLQAGHGALGPPCMADARARLNSSQGPSQYKGKLFEPELFEPKCVPDRSVRDGAERASRARYSPA